MLYKNSKLYLILDTEVKSYDQLFKITQQAVKYGVDIVQLRDKNGTAKDILKFSKRILALLKNRIPYIIDDRIDLAVIARASGVHLGQEDISVSLARKVIGKKAIIGASCQNLESALEAQAKGADYIGFGSVFKTLTKPERQPMDLKLLKRVVKKIHIPVFAIGGITKENISYLRDVGVQRVAVCRAICQARNVRKTVTLFKEALR